MLAERPEISIIIRCFNEEKHIGRLLSGILAQTRKDVEIIVVDSGSRDRTVDVARRFPVKLLTIRPERFSFGYALNYGCSHASGTYLVFASAHVYPSTDTWLENLIAAFADPRVALAYGKQRGDDSTCYIEHRIFQKLFPAESIPLKQDPYCNNANAAVRRELWERFPYDEALTGLEDLAWAKRIVSEGYHLAYCANAEVFHIHNETAAQRHNRYKREAIALKRIFPESHFNLFDFIWLYSSNCLLDFVAASRDRVLLREVAEIVRCRWHQFSGTFSGYRMKEPLAGEMKMRFFYPALFDNSPQRASIAVDATIPEAKSRTRAQRIVALVPMKAESERVPQKNIRLFNGKPLYFHIIRALLDCPLVDEVVVNTDSQVLMDEIPRTFERVTVIPRPVDLCGNRVPMNDILLHDVECVEADWYVQTHATNPLLRTETITAAIESMLSSADHDSMFSVTPVLSRFWDSSGKPINHDPKVLLRTQDLDPIYEENSNLYIFRAQTLKRLKSRIGERPLMFPIPREEAWDIDEELDFQVAEFLHSVRAGGQRVQTTRPCTNAKSGS